jgi:uncharacterized protein YjdB
MTGTRGRAWWVVALVAAGCGEPTDSDLGQLKIHPVFAAGRTPAAMGVTPRHLKVVVRRNEGSGAIAIDTTVPYQNDGTFSWVLDLVDSPEGLGISAELSDDHRVLYSGAATASVGAGIGPSTSIHDVPLDYVGPSIASIEVTPASATLTAVGGTRQFQAVARDAGGAPLEGFTFAWSSSDAAIATIDPVSGLATTVARGVTLIAATAGGVTGHGSLTVSKIASIRVSPAAATLIEVGATQTFSAEALDENGIPIPDVEFGWSSSASQVATVEGGTGVATATGIGSTEIEAVADGISGSSTLRVSTVSSIRVTPAAALLDHLNATRQFTAEALDSSGQPIPGVAFSWTSSALAIATVDAVGLATANATGTATISAAAGAVVGSATLSVTNGSGGGGGGIVVRVAPPVVTLTALGSTQQFTAQVLDSDGDPVPGAQVRWTSSAPSVATVDPSSGLATAVGRGSADIIATSSGAGGSARLTVSIIESIAVLPASAALTASGATRQFTATAYDASGKPIPGVRFDWSSSVPAVATIDPVRGEAVAVADGSTTIRARADGVVGEAELQVATGGVGLVTTIAVSPNPATIGALGGTRQFTAVARDGRGNVVPGIVIVWSSADPAAAEVDPASGLATGLTTGTTTITATGAGVSGSALLTVQQTIATVEVLPAAATVATDDSVPFTAVARDANGALIPGATFTWASSDPLVGSVDPISGLARTGAAGQTTITATSGSVVGTATLSVVSVGRIVVTPRDVVTISVGQTRHFTATVYDSGGNVIPGVLVRWTSSSPAIAVVDLVTGIATGLTPGTTRIGARAGSAFDQVSLTIR